MDLSDLSSIFGISSNSSGGGSSEASIWPSLINAGTSLAGTYFTLAENRRQNEANIQMAQDELAARLEAAKAAGGGGGGGGAGLKIAKLNNLGALYQNYGQLLQRAGEAEANAAIAGGRSATDPIMARLAVLR